MNLKLRSAAPNSVGRRLVITSAFACGPEALSPLLHSLQMHVLDVDVLVFSSDRDVERLSLPQERLPFLRLEPVAFPPQVIRGRLALARKLMVRGRRKMRRIRLFSLRDPSVAIERQVGAGLSTAAGSVWIKPFTTM